MTKLLSSIILHVHVDNLLASIILVDHVDDIAIINGSTNSSFALHYFNMETSSIALDLHTRKIKNVQFVNNDGEMDITLLLFGKTSTNYEGMTI